MWKVRFAFFVFSSWRMLVYLEDGYFILFSVKVFLLKACPCSFSQLSDPKIKILEMIFYDLTVRCEFPQDRMSDHNQKFVFLFMILFLTKVVPCLNDDRKKEKKNVIKCICYYVFVRVKERVIFCIREILICVTFEPPRTITWYNLKWFSAFCRRND